MIKVTKEVSNLENRAIVSEVVGSYYVSEKIEEELGLKEIVEIEEKKICKQQRKKDIIYI